MLERAGAMPTKYEVTYQVDKSVQPWMDDDNVVEEGETVYAYNGYTYGCIGDGIAVSRQPDQTPFFELPRDAVRELVE